MVTTPQTCATKQLSFVTEDESKVYLLYVRKLSNVKIMNWLRRKLFNSQVSTTPEKLDQQV